MRLRGFFKFQFRSTLSQGSLEILQIKSSNELISAIKPIDQISELVFTNLEGRPLRKEVLVRELRILKRLLGIEQDWVFRDLRHSFAVNFLKSGGDIAELKNILGHNHVRMTEELYGRYKTQKVDFFDMTAVPEAGVSSSEIDKFREN